MKLRPSTFAAKNSNFAWLCIGLFGTGAYGAHLLRLSYFSGRCLAGSGFDHITDNTDNEIYHLLKDTKPQSSDRCPSLAFHLHRPRT
jgi:hypothetical protein